MVDFLEYLAAPQYYLSLPEPSTTSEKRATFEQCCSRKYITYRVVHILFFFTIIFPIICALGSLQ